MKTRSLLLALAIGLASLACSDATTGGPAAGVAPFQQTSAVVPAADAGSVRPFVPGRTAYGFFPSPPEPTLDSVLGHFERMGEHADFILVQPNIPWQDFVDGVDGESQARTDLRNQITLAERESLNWIFVVDPLNGLNRREFAGLPQGWTASFADEQVRSAFTNFSLWIVRQFQPAYLGLASEINTYMDAHPDDVDSFVSLYQLTYQAVKQEAPNSQVFVTFQWDDLNNMFAGAAEGRAAYDTNWEQVELFEPNLDVWAISSYPYFVFNGGTAIPDDYYTPLLTRTDKPLAVAEGGFSSRPVGAIEAAPDDQSAYLRAIHDQLGGRLDFWTYLILSDLNMDAIGEKMAQQGRGDDVDGLSMFASIGLLHVDGSPKPALELWDAFRSEQQ